MSWLWSAIRVERNAAGGSSVITGFQSGMGVLVILVFALANGVFFSLRLAAAATVAAAVAALGFRFRVRVTAGGISLARTWLGLAYSTTWYSLAARAELYESFEAKAPEGAVLVESGVSEVTFGTSSTAERIVAALTREIEYIRSRRSGAAGYP